MPTSTATKKLTDIKDETALRTYPIVKKAVIGYLDAVNNKCWGLVDAAIEVREAGITDATEVKAMFNRAFAEAHPGGEKSPEYKTQRGLGAKAVKIAWTANALAVMDKWRKDGKGFNALYDLSVDKSSNPRPGGNKKSTKEQIEDDVNEGVANADIYAKNLSGNHSSNTAETEKSTGWTNPDISGKPKPDLWYTETKAFLTDPPSHNKFYAYITKLAKNDILSVERMVDMIEAYIGDNTEDIPERLEELMKGWIKSGDGEQVLTIMQKCCSAATESKQDDEQFEQRRIEATNQKRLVGKRRK